MSFTGVIISALVMLLFSDSAQCRRESTASLTAAHCGGLSCETEGAPFCIQRNTEVLCKYV